jgi:hypothetical protein
MLLYAVYNVEYAILLQGYIFDDVDFLWRTMMTKIIFEKCHYHHHHHHHCRTIVENSTIK